jgi:hypothetical protein
MFEKMKNTVTLNNVAKAVATIAVAAVAWHFREEIVDGASSLKDKVFGNTEQPAE